MITWPTEVLFRLLQISLWPWLRWRFRIHRRVEPGLRRSRSPVVVVANHVNFWDPFLVTLALGVPLFFVAADGNFRSRSSRVAMRLAGAIPKAKARDDRASLRTMQELVRRGKSVALFPEGQRTWDGRSRPLLPGSAKLLRLLRAPVVVVQLRGAYRSTPRWTPTLRRGRLEVHISSLACPSELRSAPLSTLTERLETALAFDEDSWQATTGQLFVAPRRAEGLEQVLFQCYHCGAWDHIETAGDYIACRCCGSRWWYGPSGALYPRRVPLPDRWSPITVADWQNRQLPALAAALQFPAPGNSPQPGPLPYFCPGVQLFTGYRTRPLTPHGVVECRLTRRELVVGTPPATTVPIAEIQGLNVQYAAQLEFYWRRRLYVLRFHRSSASAYRVEQTIKRLQEITLQDH